VIGEIPLLGKPEFAVVDGHGSVFDALEDKSPILKINANTLAIEARWNLPEESGPSGLASTPLVSVFSSVAATKPRLFWTGPRARSFPLCPLAKAWTPAFTIPAPRKKK
jgi:hypothetical protein